MNTTENDWIITTNRYVAYIDIMGFKDMVARTSHEDIYEMMKKIESKKKFSENVKWGKYEIKYVTTTTYSDSIMIYSKDDSYESLHSFICTVSSLTQDLLTDGIPHKGAIAFGLMTLDKENSIFFGQPLIDAYLLQEELYFYGIIVHCSAEKKINNEKKVVTFNINYPCPLKNGTAVHLTIFPMCIGVSPSVDKNVNKETDALLLSVKNLRHKTSGYLRRYIDNT